MSALSPPGLVIPATRGPIIRPGVVKWRRDQGISELIDHLDAPRLLDCKNNDERLAKLTVKEIECISTVTTRCRNDFSFCSRNFFWIAEKGRADRLLALWESQELIYEHIQRLKALGVPQKIFIIKARQLGCSTLIEALIAWRTMFYRNVTAMVISYNPRHAGELFAIMQHIYDQMPWWLKPMCSSREYQDGLTFSNPDPDQRRANPGLKSRIKAEGSNKRTGVGQGLSISAAHISEISDYHPDDAREIIEEDLGNALADNQETFAIIETTAKGAGNYTYDFWNKCVELEEQGQAEWYPLFLPWFFEKTRVWPPEKGWRPETPESEMRERVECDWLRCDNPDCRQYHERYKRLKDRSDDTCFTCRTGVLRPYILADDQMRWMQRKRKNSEKDSESLKKLRQEQATTSEEAFQVSGVAVFGEGAQEFVNLSIRPAAKRGFIDKSGKFHGADPKNIRVNNQSGEYYEACYLQGCDQDHSFGDENGEGPLQIWKEPEKDAEYCIGADVSEGLGGEADYSVGFIIKVNRRGGTDEHVATFRSNLIDPVAFALVLNFLGRWYNEAMMSIEVNRYDTTQTWIRLQCQYPNIYRWKHMDSLNIMSSKLGWFTQANSKPRLWQTMKRWLQFKLIHIYDRQFAKEMKTFVKDDYEGRSASSEGSSHDDVLMAAMIALYTAHEADWDDNSGQMSIKRELTLAEAPWHMHCKSCDYVWATHNSQGSQCERCQSRVIEGRPNRDPESNDRQSNPFSDGDIPKDQAQEWTVSTDVNVSDQAEPEYSLL